MTDEAHHKRLARALAGEREKELADARRRHRRVAAIKRRLVRLRSGKSATPAKRNQTRDEIIFNGIKAALHDGDITRLTATAAPTVTDYRRQKRRIRTETILPDGRTAKESIFWTPTWDHAGDALKYLAWGQIMYRENGFAMSVHLGDDVLTLAKLKNEKRPGGFTTYVRNRLSHGLRREFGRFQLALPDFFFTIETARGVDPHLHGAIIVPADRHDLVRRALTYAGGAWKGGVRQVDLQRLKTPVRWMSYIGKWREQSRIALEDPTLVAATNGLRARAREWYLRARVTGEALN